MALAEVNKSGSAANLGPNSPLYEVIAQYNDLAAKFETLLQKLDTDAGVTDENYESGVGESKKITVNGVSFTAS